MKNYLDFTGKVALVTGGRRGLGKAMADALAAHGAEVAVVARSAGEPGDDHYLQADLLQRAEREGLVAQVVERFGRLDILVNNAGFQFSETAETCTLEQWDASRAGLLDAVYELSRQAIPVMKAQGGGKIINIASICAFREGGGNFSYGVMKAAVVGMTRCMANSVARYGINVNAIAPGIIRTDLTAHCFEPERLAHLVTKYPAGRLGEPEDIAGPLLFLASDLSQFMHGETLVVDGGFCGN